MEEILRGSGIVQAGFGVINLHMSPCRIDCVWRCVKLEAGHAKTSLYMSGRRAFRMRPRLKSFEGEQVYPCSTEIQADLEKKYDITCRCVGDLSMMHIRTRVHPTRINL